MKKIFQYAVYLTFMWSCTGLLSCKDELPQPLRNSVPVANAGADQLIILPADNVVLDGSASADADGKIAKYLWRKVEGPTFFIKQADAVKVTVQSLVQGYYQFELMVTDDKGASDKDTVDISVTTGTNQSPIANAGVDQVLYFPEDSCTLDGNASHDPDGSISMYQWRRIKGPWSVLLSPNALQTQVTNMEDGLYQFELKVVDNGGIMAKDTVQVTVYAFSPCVTADRPLVNATAIQMGALSEARFPYVGAAGNKIVFAGGALLSEDGWFWVSSSVEIYDVNTESWSTTQLSQEREGIAVANCGNKIFFAGGGTFGGIYGNGLVDIAYDNVDIYDISTNSWSVLHLALPVTYMAAASVGNRVYFAGGIGNGYVLSNRVDIYDLSTSSWSSAELSEPRAGLTAVATGDKIYFAGGYNDNGPSSIVDIYDANTNNWSTSNLQDLSGSISGVVKDDQIFWAGQIIKGRASLGKVEVWNTSNGSITTHCLSYSRYAPVGIVRDNEVAFFVDNGWWDLTLTRGFDIYNTETNQWSTGIFPFSIASPAIIKANNTIYMGGGSVGNHTPTDKVHILDW